MKPKVTLDQIKAAHRKLMAGKWVSIRDEETEDDLGDSVKRQLHQRAAEMLLISDVLFVRCREPILAVNPFSGEIGIEEAFSENHWSSSRSMHSGSLYSSALRDASGLYDFLRSNDKKGARTCKFEVFDDKACGYDGVTEDIRFSVKNLALALRSDLMGLPREAIDVLFSIENWLEQSKRLEAVVSPQLIDSLERLCGIDKNKGSTITDAMVRYQMKRDHLTFRNGREGSNFHLAMSESIINSRFQACQEIARLCLSRWQHAIGHERLAVDSTYAMCDVSDGLVCRKSIRFLSLRLLLAA